MAVTLATVRRAMREHDGELFVQATGAGGVSATIWTMPGTVWVSSGGHCLAGYSATDRTSVWLDLLERMDQGTQPCKLSICDTCREGSDDAARYLSHA